MIKSTMYMYENVTGRQEDGSAREKSTFFASIRF